MNRTNAQVWRRIQTIEERAARCPHYREFELHCNGYAEPGYSDPESGIIATGDWNRHYRYQEPETKADLTMPRVAALLEKLGVELEWEDEWTECSDCNKLVRTSPDSYSWQPSYWRSDEGDIQCEECVLADPGPYLEWLEGNEIHCMTMDLDLEDQGYKLLEGRLEHGLYGGQDANPHKIAKALRAIDVERFIFTLDSTGQFDIEFSIWVHKDEWPKIQCHRAQWRDADKRCDLDPSVACQRALQDASAKMAQLPDGQGIKYASCKSDGTADVRLVSPEEFVNGIREG